MKKAIALALTVALLFSAAVTIKFAKIASADPFLEPEQPPVGFTINSDGTYSGVNIQRDGNIYTLTGNINCSIVIQRDEVVLDGAGYSLQGNGSSAGIWLQDKSSVTIKNLNIKNFGYGIKFTHNNFSPNTTNLNCAISANNITNNTYGISLGAYSNCYVEGNYLADNTNGIGLYDSSSTFRNNRLESNQYDILDEGYGDNNIDTSNTIDGKPIYYLINQQDMTVPANAGLVVLKNCSRIKVQNLNLKGNENGLLLCYTDDCIISGNIISDNLFGIITRQCFNITITGNQITNNPNSGIDQYQSNYTRITDNIIRGNGDGVSESDSQSNVISGNQIISNERGGIDVGPSSNVSDNYVFGNLGNGIFLENISGCTVSGNNVTQNTGCGIGLGYGPNGIVKGNYISNNNVGIWISNAAGNTIMSNMVAQNSGWGIRLEGSQQNNIIYHNNFVGNNNGGIQASITELWVYPDLFKRLSPGQTPRPPELVSGAANTWDDGREGNYWSDYMTRYPDAQKVENSTVGNTPYYINENNQDNHPLLAPHEISTLELPSATPSSNQPPQETNPTSTPVTKLLPEPFPTMIVIASLLIIVLAGMGLLVYFKKRRRLNSPCRVNSVIIQLL